MTIKHKAILANIQEYLSDLKQLNVLITQELTRQETDLSNGPSSYFITALGDCRDSAIRLAGAGFGAQRVRLLLTKCDCAAKPCITHETEGLLNDT